MSTTFTDLVTQISLEMADTTWDDTYVASWLNMALRDYSKYFPLLKEQTISCSAGEHTYDLNADYMGVVSVEYPSGQEPQAYLGRLPRTHADFWRGERWYDILDHADDSDPAELVISAETAVGESISVTYHAHQVLIANPASISGSCTVPVTHHNLLSLYVFWQNALALANAEQQTPASNSSLLMAQLAQNARRAENAYHVALQQAIYAVRGNSKTVQWINGRRYNANDDSLARVY